MQLQNDSINTFLPFASLVHDRDNDIQALERELKVLEGEDGDDDDDYEAEAALDSSLIK